MPEPMSSKEINLAVEEMMTMTTMMICREEKLIRLNKKKCQSQPVGKNKRRYLVYKKVQCYKELMRLMSGWRIDKKGGGRWGLNMYLWRKTSTLCLGPEHHFS